MNAVDIITVMFIYGAFLLFWGFFLDSSHTAHFFSHFRDSTTLKCEGGKTVCVNNQQARRCSQKPLNLPFTGKISVYSQFEEQMMKGEDIYNSINVYYLKQSVPFLLNRVLGIITQE